MNGKVVFLCCVCLFGGYFALSLYSLLIKNAPLFGSYVQHVIFSSIVTILVSSSLCVLISQSTMGQVEKYGINNLIIFCSVSSIAFLLFCVTIFCVTFVPQSEWRFYSWAHLLLLGILCLSMCLSNLIMLVSLPTVATQPNSSELKLQEKEGVQLIDN